MVGPCERLSSRYWGGAYSTLLLVLIPILLFRFIDLLSLSRPSHDRCPDVTPLIGYVYATPPMVSLLATVDLFPAIILFSMAICMPHMATMVTVIPPVVMYSFIWGVVPSCGVFLSSV